MTITVTKGGLFDSGAELLVIPVFAQGEFESKQLKSFDEALQKRAMKAAKALDFSGKLGQSLLLPVPAGSNADDVLLVGVGEKKREQIVSGLREAAGIMVTTAKRRGLRTIAIDLTQKDFKEDAAEALATAALLADYTFETYKKGNPDKKLGTIDILAADARMVAAMRKRVQHAQTVLDGVTIARDLVNTPAQEMTPAHLSEAARKIAEASNGTVSIKILNREECAELKMGAYLAVAQGAHHEPKFIHLTYTSPRPTKKSLAVVGKGVTFDSGGLSLKPADAMMSMKCDMAGAAAVIGFFATLARLKPRVNIHGVIAATENMVSGTSIRPGDIVHASNGKSIEILNTDAEGRLTLADAMTYILKEKPDAMIDLATLTGACVVALGEEITGLMTNDKVLGRQVLEAAARAGEKMWELPLEARYRDQINSDIADLRNIPTSRYGGSLTAGLFLQEFVEGKPWVHLDIAGPAFAERPMSSYLGKGGTGHGVRTLVDFVEHY
ncbi:MAG: leucyl aminopeptidase [Patescibacteria group bacterium]|jgi:leucyl aminopeptidase|nr:leucyl aminopeptidase [Patescibacteria group bacterium]